jgi:SWI/SNF-related matrix-associated actin-dependent regulator 1 of chromatin subfamily A
VPVLMKIKRVLLLSGTPILARPNELYNLLRVVRPDIFFSFKDFGLRFCCPKESYFGIDWTGSSNQRELHLMLEKGLMIRRLKSEVLTELPAKRRQRIIVPCEATALKKIKEMLKKVKNWDDEKKEKESKKDNTTNDEVLKEIESDFKKLAEKELDEVKDL